MARSGNLRNIQSISFVGVAMEDSQDAESQWCGVAGEDSQDAEGQRNAMMVSDELISPKSHRQTSVLGTDIHSGTGTEVIQATPIVVPTLQT